MTPAAAGARLVAKEVRALAVVWLVCLATMITADGVVRSTAAITSVSFRSLGIAAYFFGTAALGALAVGHEYSHRTLTLLLAQPVSRKRLLLAKLGVLAAMLLTLATVAAFSLFNPSGPLRASRALLTSEYGPMAQWFPVLCGLMLAPWLTMVTRNPIAGGVFTVSIPGVLLVGGEILGMAIYGRFAPEVNGFRMQFFRAGALFMCALGAVLGWRRFMRLEAIEGRDADIRLPWPLPRSSVRERSGAKPRPLWLLVKKELHLQQMSFVVAAIYVLLSLGLASVQGPNPATINAIFNVSTIMYLVLIALVIGSVASAEERHLGTHDSQVLQPIAIRTQWRVKVAVVLALTVVNVLALPLLTTAIGRALDITVRTSAEFNVITATLAIIIACGALYISSLSTNGVQALLISVASMPLIALFVSLVVAPIARWALGYLFVMAMGVLPEPPWLPVALVPILGAGVAAVVLHFALANHRAREGGARRVSAQLLAIAASLVAAAVLWAAIVGAAS